MSRTVWTISVIIEAVALCAYQWRYRSGGFFAFRLMLLMDVIGQSACLLARPYDAMYRPIFRTAALVTAIMTAFAMIEAAPECRGAARRSMISLGLGTLSHMLLYEPVYWSKMVGFVWAFVAFGHLLMACYLVLTMAESGRWSPHSSLLTVYMLGIAFMFYLAPLFSMAHSVEIWNGLVWVGFIVVCVC